MRQMRANCGPLGVELYSRPCIAKMNMYAVFFFIVKEMKSLNQYNVKERRWELNSFLL